jgi:hypothetical protein
MSASLSLLVTVIVAAMASRSDRRPTFDALASQVAKTFAHRLFPSYRDPSYLACPNDESAAITLDAVTRAAKSKGVATEFIDLRRAPADRVNVATARLHDFAASHRRVAPRRRR